jgi:hypothetical protein
MHGETKTRASTTKRNTTSATCCTSIRRGPHHTSSNKIQPQQSQHPIVRPARAIERNNDPDDVNSNNKSSESQVSVADYVEEVVGATYELFDEVRYAIVAVSRAVATLCRLSVRAATLVLAVTCLTLAVGMWAWTVGKGVWSKMFA